MKLMIRHLYRDIGRRDGDTAGRQAIRVLADGDAPGRLVRAVEQQLAELSHIAADALERGAPGSAIEAYRAAWRAGFEGALDELAVRLLPLLPDDPADDEDGDDR